MQFIRKIINSDEIEKGIQMPRELQHRKVEVLIFPVDPAEDTQDWSALSLSQAMRGMEDEATPVYSTKDIKASLP